jgi:hypothetical protein
MNKRNSILLLVTLLAGAALCFAADPSIGTWKLNEAKSKLVPGMPKNVTVTYEAAGDDVKATVDGVDGKGNPTHNVWTGKFDGKDYAVTGDPSSDTRAMKKIDDSHLELTVKKDGKVTMTGKIVIAADGRSRVLTVSATDAAGKKVEAVSAYDKQ